ncbi:MAG TPA: HEAT repeat domain-containing protein, partial [Ktedonobacteraceae bacterium]|nr:HEAT repeat domain-containing protein [Ktedonobacteraceae bacterium]
INPEHLIKFASDPRQPVRDAALRALSTLDAGQGIPTLLEALNDERARVAIYALRNSLLSIPQSEALQLLRNASLEQVTVAKEVVRLIGDLLTDAAYRELLLLDSRELHRDVRIALLRAFWPYLDRSKTWEIFTKAAQSPDAALARGVIYIPADGMSPLVQRRLAILLTNLLAHPEPEVRVDALKRCVQYPLTDYEHVLLTHLVKLMNSPAPGECALAAKAAFVTYRGNDASLVGDAVRNMLDNRRALHITIENFLLALNFDRRHLLPTTRAILTALSEDQLTITLRIGIIVLGLPWEEATQELVKLTDSLHADALGRAQSAIQQAIRRPDANLFSLEMTLATSNDERLRRLAFAALIAQSKQVNGWSDERITRLQAYREDTSPLVAEAAQFTFVS